MDRESGKSLYEEMGGFDAILCLCRRWHARCLGNPAAAHPFEHDLHPFHDERLAAYLSEAFGGPKLYLAGYGDESSVQRLHACNGEHDELDEVCLSEFAGALDDVGIAPPTSTAALAYFRRATLNMRQYSAPDAIVPDGLPLNVA